jgi:hypothetical protein
MVQSQKKYVLAQLPSFSATGAAIFHKLFDRQKVIDHLSEINIALANNEDDQFISQNNLMLQAVFKQKLRKEKMCGFIFKLLKIYFGIFKKMDKPFIKVLHLYGNPQ